MAENEKFDEFMEEIQGDIRQEKLLNFWNQYKKIIISTSAFLLISVSSYSLWSNYQLKQLNLNSDKIITAQELLSNNKLSEAIGVLNSVETSAKAYGPIAQLLIAAVEAEKNNNTIKAIEVYDKIATTSKIDAIYKDHATIQSVRLKLDSKKFKDIKELEAQVSTVKETSPWYLLALEMKAIISLHQKDYKKALEIFAQIIREPNTPQGLSTRAQLISQQIRGNIGENEEKKDAA